MTDWHCRYDGILLGENQPSACLSCSSVTTYLRCDQHRPLTSPWQSWASQWSPGQRPGTAGGHAWPSPACLECSWMPHRWSHTWLSALPQTCSPVETEEQWVNSTICQPRHCSSHQNRKFTVWINCLSSADFCRGKSYTSRPFMTVIGWHFFSICFTGSLSLTYLIL